MSDEHGAQRVNTTSSDDALGRESQPRHGLADFLVDRDVGCPVCGFNLRGLAGNRCPECSTRIQLVIARPDDLVRRRGWLLAAALALWVSSMVSVASHIMTYVRWGSVFASPGAWLQIASMILMCGVCIGLVVVLLRYAARRGSPKALPELFVSVLAAMLATSIWGTIANLLWFLF